MLQEEEVNIPRPPVKAVVVISILGVFLGGCALARHLSHRPAAAVENNHPQSSANDNKADDMAWVKKTENAIDQVTKMQEDCQKKGGHLVQQGKDDYVCSVGTGIGQQDSQKNQQLLEQMRFLQMLRAAEGQQTTENYEPKPLVFSYRGKDGDADGTQGSPAVVRLQRVRDQESDAVAGGAAEPVKNQTSGSFACGSEQNYWEACIPEGTVIPAVLVNKLSGDFTGPVIAKSSQTIMSQDKKRLLIPAGTVIIGESGRVQGQDQSRLAIIFHVIRLASDNAFRRAGWLYPLDKQQGLSVDGSAGEVGDVNHHWLSTIAAAGAYGALAGFSLQGTGSALTTGGIGVYRQGLSEELGMQGQSEVAKLMNRLPTVTVPIGTECDVYLSKDLVMR